jgi:hypothetical protein
LVGLVLVAFLIAIFVIVLITIARSSMIVAVEIATLTAWPIVASIGTIVSRWTVRTSEPATFLAIARRGRTVWAAEPPGRSFAIAEAWTVRAVAFEASFKVAIARASWRRAGRMWHVFVDVLGQFFEFVLAQLFVLVLIELGKQLLWLRHMGRRATWPWMAIRTIAARFGSAITWTAATFATPSTWTIALATAELAHLFSRLFALFLIKLAVAVFIELFHNSLAELDANFFTALFAFLGIIIVRGLGRHGQQAEREADEACDQIPHDVPSSEWLVVGVRDSSARAASTSYNMERKDPNKLLPPVSI